MITKKQIRANELLAVLDDTRIAAIVEMVGEVQAQYDTKFREILGVQRPPEADPVDFWNKEFINLKLRASKFGKTGVAPFLGDMVDVTGATSRLEAMSMIQDSLKVNNIDPQSDRYHKIVKKTWDEVVIPRKLKMR